MTAPNRPEQPTRPRRSASRRRELAAALERVRRPFEVDIVKHGDKRTGEDSIDTAWRRRGEWLDVEP